MYAVIGLHKLSTGDRLLKIRNPHGEERYWGSWSDHDSRWTPSLRAEVGSVYDPNDGVFFMDVASFQQYFLYTTINEDIRGWYHDAFLMLDDQTSKDGAFSEHNRQHELTVTSQTAQRVHILGHVWPLRVLSDDCKDEISWSTYNYMQVGEGYMQTWGDYDYESYVTFTVDMEPGETIPVIIELDHSNESLAADWSVVAWGESGEVKVCHSEGLPSDSMPYTPSDEPVFNATHSMTCA